MLLWETRSAFSGFGTLETDLVSEGRECESWRLCAPPPSPTHGPGLYQDRETKGSDHIEKRLENGWVSGTAAESGT